MYADKLYLGNIITMDEHNPNAKALTVKDGYIQYVGNVDVAHSLCNKDTEVIDLGTNTIYPGFLEAHCHPVGAGNMLDKDGSARLVDGCCLEDYVDIMADFIKKHPGRKFYTGNGFMVKDKTPTASLLDTKIPDIPVFLTSVDGHSCWLNTKSMKLFGIDKNAAIKYGSDQVHVDDYGMPTGYLSEAPVFEIRKLIPRDIENTKRSLLVAQDFFLGKGYTAVYDAGLEVIDKNSLPAYIELIKEGKYKIRTYAGSLVDEKCEDVVTAVNNIAELQKKYNNEYLKIIGVKTFTDGVVEAHTALLLDDYSDQPGYKGVARMHEHKKLVDIYKTASKLNMNVHVHTVGDGAVSINLDAIEEAIKITGNSDSRNALAHLQLVNKDDYKRFADLNVIAVVAPLWSPKHPDYYKQELEYIGEKRAEHAYPVRSFVDNNVITVYHNDFPVSQIVDIPVSIYTATKRRNPDSSDQAVRNISEAVSRYEALKSMTLNVAYMWHEENRMGSLCAGKLANMTVFDKDFLNDDIEDIAKSKLICTIIDGDIVYQP